MDTTRWKSILVPRHTYDEIVAAAKIEGRTISGHMRIVFEFWKQKTNIRLQGQKRVIAVTRQDGDPEWYGLSELKDGTL